MPNFFLLVDLIFHQDFFQILSPPPAHMGSAVFLNNGLTQTTIAIAVPPYMGTLPKHQESDKEMQNL